MKLTNTDVEEAFKLLHDGHSVRALAKKYEVDHKALTKRFIKKYGENYLDRGKPTATLELLREYSKSSNPKIREAALVFIQNEALRINQTTNREFLTLQQEKNKLWTENYSGIDYNYLDSRRNKGVIKVC